MVAVRYRKLQFICCSSIATLLFLIGVALIVAGAVVMKVVLPRNARNIIMEGRFLGKNPDGTLNTLTNNWAKPRYAFYTQYWIYNYTNPLEVQNRGNAPDMFEKGPYSYRTIQTKTIEDFAENDNEVLYRTKSVYVFDKSMSCADCQPNDIFLVPDIVFFKTMNMMTNIEGLKKVLCSLPSGDQLCNTANPEALNDLLNGIIKNYTEYASIAIKALDAGPFVYATVDQLLFSGYDDPLFTKVVDFALKVIETMSPPLGQQLPSNISSPKIQLNSINNMDDVVYTIATGKNDATEIGKVRSFYVNENSTNNSNGTSLPESWWFNPDLKQCPPEINAIAREIKGTMGDLFKSQIQKTNGLYVYDTNLRRSVRLEYKDEIIVRGVKGYRFAISDDTFNLSMASNCGFCHRLQYDIFSKKNGSLCLPDGLLDISRCLEDNLPIAVSNAHFLSASKEVTRTFLRLKADANTFQTTFDIEPITGTLLKSNRRIQLNVMVNRIAHSRTYQAMLPATYPILWINESALIDKNEAKELNGQLEGPDGTGTIRLVCWIVGIGVGSLFVVIAILMCTFSIFSWFAKEKRNKSVKNDVNDSSNQSTAINVDDLTDSNLRFRSTRHNSKKISMVQSETTNMQQEDEEETENEINNSSSDSNRRNSNDSTDSNTRSAKHSPPEIYVESF